MSRLFELLFSLLLFFLALPLMVVISIAIFVSDFHSPMYFANRIGRHGKSFKMIKFRTMVVNAESFNVFSTSAKDPRITAIGAVLRKYKLDELPQLTNIIKGDMSFVGPRPNVISEVENYNDFEKDILLTNPGVTDISSIVFSDEAEILKDSLDPDLDYNILIRPLKSRLAVLYLKNKSLKLDIYICYLTAISLFGRERALQRIYDLLRELNFDEEFLDFAARKKGLIKLPLPHKDA